MSNAKRQMMTCQQTPEEWTRNIAPNAMEMVRILASKDGNGNLIATLRAARGEDLFRWWHEAMCHASTAPASSPWEGKMGEALASEIAKEALRRLGP
jgi:hypothetical protein